MAEVNLIVMPLGRLNRHTNRYASIAGPAHASIFPPAIGLPGSQVESSWLYRVVGSIGVRPDNHAAYLPFTDLIAIQPGSAAIVRIYYFS